MRSYKIAVASMLLIFSSVAAQAAVMPTYDFETGELILADAMGEVGFRINADPSALRGGEATNIGGAASGTFGVVNDQADGGFIEWGNLVGMTFADSRSAGFVIVPGTDPSELEFLVATAQNPTAPMPVALTVINQIPEPMTALLAAFALIGAAAQRRRS